MKPHPRIRKTVKVGGAVIAVLACALWLVSGWCAVGWGRAFTIAESARRVFVVADRGCLMLLRLDYFDSSGDPKGFFARPHDREFLWLPQVGGVEWGGGLRVPFWAVALTAAGFSAWAWRRDALAARIALGRACPFCRYSLVGLPAGTPCPECGRANPTEPTAASGDTAPDSPPRHRDAEGSPS